LEPIEELVHGKITESDKKRIEALGLIEEKKSSIEETLDILEGLKEEGIDVTNIQTRIQVNNKRRHIYLHELDDENIEKVIERLGLDRKYPIGMRLQGLISSYKGTRQGKITESDKKRIEELGLIKEEKSAVEETLEILESLKEEGIDVSKIKRMPRINGKQRTSYLCEIENENIEQIIGKLGLDREYPIGYRITTMLNIYKGTLMGRITEDDKRRIEDLGILTELDKKVVEQNRLKKKQEETKKLKSKVKQELDKQNDNKDLGDSDE